MPDPGIILAVLTLSAAVFAFPIWRHSSLLAVLAFFFATFIASKHLVRSDVPRHFGISEGSTSLATYDALVVALVVGILGAGLLTKVPRILPTSAWLFIILAPAALFTIWTPNQAEVAGVVALVIGLAAWGVGAYFGPRVFRDPEALLYFTYFLVGLIAFEALVCALQAAGSSIFPPDANSALYVQGRSVGTFSHPAILGKAVFVSLILLLLALQSANQATRRAAWIGIAVAFVPLGLSQGRANMVAAAALLILWSALLPRTRRNRASRVAVPLVLLIVALPFTGALAERFREDPDGGGRPQLTTIGLQQIAERPLVGLGPNDYVHTVSAFDPMAVLGFPVHNAILLTAAEMGIPFAILFWMPIVGTLLTCWTRKHRAEWSGASARVLLAATPGLYLTLTTGWGFLTAPNITLLMFVFGTAWALLHEPRVGMKPNVPNSDRSPTSAHVTRHPTHAYD